MARLRFPGRPGYRFDRIGVRYGADEARQTTDPSLAVVASIHKGLQRFRDLFGDSDEDEEFHGFSSSEVKNAERQLFKYEQAYQEYLARQAAKEDRDKQARSEAALASLTAAAVSMGSHVPLERSGVGRKHFGKTFKQILDTGLVQNYSVPIRSGADGKKKKSSEKNAVGGENITFVGNGALLQQDNNPVRERITSLKHVKLKRLAHGVDGQAVYRRPVGRPRKNSYYPDEVEDPTFINSEGAVLFQGSSRPSAKYRSAAQQLLAKATKLHHSGSASFTSPTASNKVRKFVLPTKSSRSSRVIKPNKRFLEEDNSVHSAIVASASPCGAGGKLAKYAETGGERFMLQSSPKFSMLQPSTSLPSSSGDAPFKKSIFGIEVDDQKPGSLGGSSVFPSSPFLHHSPGGLASLSPFNLNREKGFPSFSAAPQPSGTSSFTDKFQFESSGLKAVGQLDQPLIVEGKRPRKPSLIMRMKLVEDDPEDEVRLQQSLLADSASPPKSLGNCSVAISSCNQAGLPTATSSMSALSNQTTLGYGTSKSLIAPAKLFTDPTSMSLSKFSKSKRHKLKTGLVRTQQTVVLRQAKLQLNRAALNRSKAALARSLKATLKREARLERKRKFSHRKSRKSEADDIVSGYDEDDVSAASGLLNLSNASVPALSPTASAKLSQLSPFSLQTSGAMVEKSKQGLFQGMEGKNTTDIKQEPPASPALSPSSTVAAGAEEAGTATASTPTPSVPAPSEKKMGRPRKPKSKPDEKFVEDDDDSECEFWGGVDEDGLDDHFESLVKDEDVLREYRVGERNLACLVCWSKCRIVAGRKLPNLPFCKPCKKAYFFQQSKGNSQGVKRRCVSKTRPYECGPETVHSLNNCAPCKYRRFCGVLRKAHKLGVEARLWSKSIRPPTQRTSCPTVKWKNFICKGPTKTNVSSSDDDTDIEFTTPKKRGRRKSKGDFSGSDPAQAPGKIAQGKRHRSLSGASSDYARQQDVTQSKHLDQPLSVDVGDTSGSFTLSPPQTVSSTKSSPGKSGRTPSKKGLGHEESSDGFSARRSRGPRIKHVCRRAAMVFPAQRALFPGEGLAKNGPLGGKGLSAGGAACPQGGGGHTLTLSALPNEEKQHVLARTKMKKEFEKYSSSEDSEDDHKPRQRLNTNTERKLKTGSAKKEKKAPLSSPFPMKENKLGMDEEEEAWLEEDGNQAGEGGIDGEQRRKRKFKLHSSRQRFKSLRKRERRIRCRKCKGCLTPECGNCVTCRDKPKFGGRGMMRKPCIHSLCLNLRKARQATDAFIEPKSPERFRRPDNNDDDNNGGYHHWGNGGQASSQRSKLSEKSNGGREGGGEINGKRDGEGPKDAEEADSEMYTDSDYSDTSEPHPGSHHQVKRGLDLDGSQVALNYQQRRAAGAFDGPNRGGAFGRIPRVSATVQLALSDQRLGRGLAKKIAAAEAAFVGKMKKKKAKKQEAFKLKPVDTETAYSVDVPLKKHLIKADYQEDYDVETAWLQGYALTVTGPSCVRTLCFLCGSAGKHQMIFCIVCCQSFHNFCLEEEERPDQLSVELTDRPGSKEHQLEVSTTGADEEGEEGNSNHHSSSNSSALTQHRGSTSSASLSWCCRRCQFCHVCGQQNGLLKCHRCRNTYHPECLGPNYPAKPSKKNIWVCTKCVRCKSCGATTPGVGINATWTYDFSLCHECGKLMDKGNFCPICHQCYSDDDWESKMIQCSSCECWVHAKCEEMTDEMYQLIACLPDDYQYKCRVCANRNGDEDCRFTSSAKDHKPLSKSSYWQGVLQAQLLRGLLEVLTCLLGSKCTQVLQEATAPPTWSRRAKPKSVEGSKTVTVKEVGRPGSDGQTLSDLPQTVTVNLDGGDDVGLQESLSTVPGMLITAAPTANTTTLADSPQCSASSLAMNICQDTSNATNTEMELSSVGAQDHARENSHQILRSPSSPETESADEGKCQNNSRGLSFNQTGAFFESESKNFDTEGANDVAPQSVNNVVVSLDDDTEEQYEDEQNRLKSHILETTGVPQANTVCLEAPQSKRNPTLTDLLSSPYSALTIPAQTTPNSSPKTADSSTQAPMFTHTLRPSALSVKDNGVQKQSQKLSALLSGPPYPLGSRQSSPSFTNPKLPTFPFSGTNVSLKQSETTPVIATSSVPLSCASNSVVPTSSSSSSPSVSSTLTCVQSKDDSVNSFYSEFQRFLSKAQPPSAECSTSSSESSIAIPQEAFVNHPSCSSSSSSSTLINVTGPSGMQSLEESATVRTTTPGSVSVDLSVPSSQSEATSAVAIVTHSTCTTVVTMQSCTTASMSTVSGMSVTFDSITKDNESDGKSGEFPSDFMAVREKIGTGSYSTVEQFSEDMVRIIQAMLLKNENYPSRKKLSNSVRSIFVKQMERTFPWFNVKMCKLWEHNKGLPQDMLRDAVLPPSIDHTYAQWLERQVAPMNPQPSPFKKNSTPQRRSSEDTQTDESILSPGLPQEADDTRTCLLCGRMGDDDPNDCGRLLYCGQDDWIHINCALWSAEVFEELDGSLQNVMETVNRGKKLRCDLCQEVGATVGCCASNCHANYHFMCARKDGCLFQDNRMLYCKLHPECVDSELIQEGQFAVLRRVCVDLNKMKAKSPWAKAVDPSILSVLIGSCTIESLGVLKSYVSDTEGCLLPVDFCCTRIYWSTQDARRRCVYTCKIVEVKPSGLDCAASLIQDMRVIHDPTHPDFVPLDQLNLENSGVPNFMKLKPESVSNEAVNMEVTGGCDGNTNFLSVNMSSATSVAGLRTISSSVFSYQAAMSTLNYQDTGVRSRRASSWSHCGDYGIDSPSTFVVDPENPFGETSGQPDQPKTTGTLSPVAEQALKPAEKKKPKIQDLSCLSPSTLALLNIKDPKHYVSPKVEDTSKSVRGSFVAKSCGQQGEEELGLINIANRLNKAASFKPKSIKPPLKRRSSSSPLATAPARRKSFVPLPLPQMVNPYNSGTILPPIQSLLNTQVQQQRLTHQAQYQQPHVIVRGQSLSPLTVMPRPIPRPRSNSEESQRSGAGVQSIQISPSVISTSSNTSDPIQVRGRERSLPPQEKKIFVVLNDKSKIQVSAVKRTSPLPGQPPRSRAVFRARSQSPFTVISTLDTRPKIHDFRSASLSPPPVTRGPGFSLLARSGPTGTKPCSQEKRDAETSVNVNISSNSNTSDNFVEIPDSDEEGNACNDDLKSNATQEKSRSVSEESERRFDCIKMSMIAEEPHLREHSIAVTSANSDDGVKSNVGESEEAMSSEGLRSLLDSVPQDVLEGSENVQLVVLPPGSTDGLSEEDVVKLAQSVVSSSDEAESGDKICKINEGDSFLVADGESDNTKGCDGIHGCGSDEENDDKDKIHHSSSRDTSHCNVAQESNGQSCKESIEKDDQKDCIQNKPSAHGNAEEKECVSQGDDKTSNTNSTGADKGGGNEKASSTSQSSSSHHENTSLTSGGQSKGGASGRRSSGGGGGGDRREPWNSGAGRTAQDKTEDSSEEKTSEKTPEAENEDLNTTIEDGEENLIAENSLEIDEGDEANVMLSTNSYKSTEKGDPAQPKAETTQGSDPTSEADISVQNAPVPSDHCQRPDINSDKTSPSGEPMQDESEQGLSKQDVDEDEFGEIEQARGESVVGTKTNNGSNNNSIFQPDHSAVSIAEETPTEGEDDGGEMEIIDLSDADIVPPQGIISVDLQKPLLTKADGPRQETQATGVNLTFDELDPVANLQPPEPHKENLLSPGLPTDETTSGDINEPDLIEKNEEEEKSEQLQHKKKRKQTCKVFVNRQDVTDEDSDYQMLDDFSYSETTTTTNGDDEDQSGRSSAEVPLMAKRKDCLEISEEGEKRDMTDVPDNSMAGDCERTVSDDEKEEDLEHEAMVNEDNKEDKVALYKHEETNSTPDQSIAIFSSTDSIQENANTVVDSAVSPTMKADESIESCQESPLRTANLPDQEHAASAEAQSSTNSCNPGLHTNDQYTIIALQSTEVSSPLQTLATSRTVQESLPLESSQVLSEEKLSPASTNEEDQSKCLPDDGSSSLDKSKDLCGAKTLQVSVRQVRKPELQETGVPDQTVDSSADYLLETNIESDKVDNLETKEAEVCRGEAKVTERERKKVEDLELEKTEVCNDTAEKIITQETETEVNDQSPKDVDEERKEKLCDNGTEYKVDETEQNSEGVECSSVHDKAATSLVDNEEGLGDLKEAIKRENCKDEEIEKASSGEEELGKDAVSNKDDDHEVECEDSKPSEIAPKLSQPTAEGPETARERMVERIKAEGLAKSEPGEEGPFKCPMCKRLYRTKISYEAHIKDCDFEVSTSDEDEPPVVKRELRSSKKPQENVCKTPKIDISKLDRDMKEKTSPLIPNVEINSVDESEKETFERMRRERKGTSLSPLNEPLSIIIGDECREGSASSRDRDLSDDCSSQDSRRSSLRKSTMTQRNAAPAHLANQRCRDGLSKYSPDGSVATMSPSSCLLSPRAGKSSTSLAALEEKPSPKETMLEAVGLVSKRTLELSPNSEFLAGVQDIEPGSSGGEQTCAVKLQPRFSPTTMAVVPKREKRSAALTPGSSGNVGSSNKPSIMAGGKGSAAKPDLESIRIKSVTIESNPVVVTEVSIGPTKKPRKKRIWWVEASDSSGEDDGKELEEDPLAGIEEDGTVARRTRHGRQRLSEEVTDVKKAQNTKGQEATDSPTVEPSVQTAKDSPSLERQNSSDPHKLKSDKSAEGTTNNLEAENKDDDGSVNVPSLRTSRRRSLRSGTCDEDLKNDGVKGQKDCVEAKLPAVRTRRRGSEASKNNDYTDEVDSGDHPSPVSTSAGDSLALEVEKHDQNATLDSGNNTNDESDEEKESASNLVDGDRKSPVRRSCRPSSKTSKLSEFLAKLKEKEGQEKTDSQPAQTTGLSSQKRGRGRPRIYPAKPTGPAEPTMTKRGRGRPRLYTSSSSAADKVGASSDIGNSPKEDTAISAAATSESVEMEEDCEDDDIVEDENDGNVDDARSKEKRGGRKTEKDQNCQAKDALELEKGSNEAKMVATSSSVKNTDVQNLSKDKDSEKLEQTKEKEFEKTSDTEIAQGAIQKPSEKNSTSQNFQQPKHKQNTVPEALRGQKLRIIIRSPNVLAAQKVGELIKQTAQSVNPDTKDVIINVDKNKRGTIKSSESTPEITSSNEKLALGQSDPLSKQSLEQKSEKTAADLDNLCLPSSKAENETNNEESQSDSPQSLSAAYDIQSDDFSSETSNDTEDFVPQQSKMRREGENLQAESQMLTDLMSGLPEDKACGRRVSVLPLHSKVPEKTQDQRFQSVNKDNEHSDDDDVVLVKAIGLQPPEPQYAQQPLQHVIKAITTLPLPAIQTPAPLTTNAIQQNILLQAQHQHQASFANSPHTSSTMPVNQLKSQIPQQVDSDMAQARYILQQQGQQQMPMLSPPQASLASGASHLVLGNLAQASTNKQGAVLLSTNSSPILPAGSASNLIFPSGCPSNISLGSQTGLNVQAAANQPGLTLQAVNQSGLALLHGANQSGLPLQAVRPSGIAFQTNSPQGLALQSSQGGGLSLQAANQQGGGPILMNQSNAGTGILLNQASPLHNLVHGSVNPAQQPGLSIISLGTTPNIVSPLHSLHQPLGQAPSQLPQVSPNLLPGMAALSSLVERHASGGGTSRGGGSPSTANPRQLIVGQQPRLLLSQQQLQQQQLQIQYQQQQQRLQQQQQQQLPSPQSNRFMQASPLAPSRPLAPVVSQTFNRSAGSSGVSASSTLQRILPASQPSQTPPQLTPVPMASAPQLTHVDGTPAQVNYMGTFDLNSSTLSSVMSGQGITQNTTQMIKDLVQRALLSGGKDVIPGVEVRSAITDTPQGPKKVLRVFINEDILPIQRSPQPPAPPPPSASSSLNSISSSPGTQPPTSSVQYVQQYTQQQSVSPAIQTPNIAAVAAASLQPLRRSASSSTVEKQDQSRQQTSVSSSSSSQLPNWTKLLQPQFFPGYESKTSTTEGSTSSSSSLRPVTTCQELSQPSRNSKPQIDSNFQRAFKPLVTASLTELLNSGVKRKPSMGNTDASVSKRARAVFEKSVDGNYMGRLEGLVSRSLETSLPAVCVQQNAASCIDLPASMQESSGNDVQADLKPHSTSTIVRTPFDLPKYVESSSNTDTVPQAQSKNRDHTVLSETPKGEQLRLSDLLNQQPTPPIQKAIPQGQQTVSLQRASFPNPSASSATLKSQKVSLANRKNLQKHTMKRVSQKKSLKLRDPNSSQGVPRPKGLGKKGAGAHKMKIGESHHRLIHHNKKSGEQLPQPMLEEEVVATPLDPFSRGEHPAGGRGGASGKGHEQNQSCLRFEISSDDGFSCQGDTMEDAWNQVLEKVQDVRAASRMPQLSYTGVSGRSISGLENNSLIYLLEQLYGAVHCHQHYKFKFHKYDLDQADAEVGVNESGAARSEAFSTRKPFDMFNFLKSAYRTRPGDEEREKEEEMSLKSSRRATSLSLPMAMRFRKLKTFAKEAVDVYRSKIHGRGLFCKRNIDAGEMVIEYAGEVIRASLTDKREKYYEGKGIGCYMFRIDDDEVVDATMHGSAARFINHSCEPNCFSKVILVEGKKHIVIFAMRPIKRGEELTYDYKFPIEEVKIPCHCGSRRCRKYLN